jgi:hypothetical protein
LLIITIIIKMDIIIKKWVKKIPDNNSPIFSNYIKKDYFKLILNIILDTNKNDKELKKKKYIN